MAQQIRRWIDWGSIYVGEPEVMLKDLALEGHWVHGPDEVLERMTIDSPLGVDIGCETGRANIRTATDPMDTDQEARLCVGDAGLELSQTKMDISNSISQVQRPKEQKASGYGMPGGNVRS